MKKKIITILLVLSLILLIANMILGIIGEGNGVQPKKTENVAFIDSLFLHSLNEFGLDSNWVQIKHIKNKNKDSLHYVYNVKVPSDLPITIILQDLTNQFGKYAVDMLSEEQIVNRKSVLDIYSGDVHKLEAQFTADEEAVREHSKFAFIINDYSDLDDDMRAQILKSKFTLSVSFIPSENSLTFLPDITKDNKRYCIELNDNISDENYELDKGMAKILLKESIRQIIRDFPEADLVMIDNNSEIFLSAAFNFVRDQFGGESIKLYNETDFVGLPKNLEEAKSLLSFYQKSEINKNGKIFLVNGSVFTGLLNELDRYKKLGTKFYFPSELTGDGDKSSSN